MKFCQAPLISVEKTIRKRLAGRKSVRAKKSKRPAGLPSGRTVGRKEHGAKKGLAKCCRRPSAQQI